MLKRKNTQFTGSDESSDSWAVTAMLIESCKLSSIDPNTWLTETLGKPAKGHHANAVGELLPWTVVA